MTAADAPPRGCGLCFRTLKPHQRWTTCKPAVLEELMALDRPPYAPVVLAMARSSAAGRETILCDYCASFIKERSSSSTSSWQQMMMALVVIKKEEEPAAAAEEEEPRLRPGRKHGMHMTVEHLLSGGAMPAPSRPHFLRCLAVLEQEQKDDEQQHPFLASGEGELHDRLAARRSPLLSPYPDCVIRWVFEGQQRVFSDGILAKHLRRWVADADERRVEAASSSSSLVPTVLEGMPPACRFCCCRLAPTLAPAPAAVSSYAGALFFPPPSSSSALATTGISSIEAALLAVEREVSLNSALLRLGPVFFCLACHRTTAISYAYDRALRERVAGLLPCCPTPDAYYAHLIALFRRRQQASSFFWGTNEEHKALPTTNRKPTTSSGSKRPRV